MVRGGALGLAWALDADGADPLAIHWWGILERYSREWCLSESLFAQPPDLLPGHVLMKAFARASWRRTNKLKRAKWKVAEAAESPSPGAVWGGNRRASGLTGANFKAPGF